MQQKNAKICVIQLNENNGNGNASVVFLFLFIWCGGAFFNNVLHRNAISVFLCSFHQFSMFCLCSNLSPCNFCLFVVPLHLRFCFFRKNFKYAVAMCVGYFTTTFCTEMQCRFFFAVFINFQCFVCAVIFRRVIFVCWLCSCSCDFVFHGSFVFLYVNCRGGCRKKYHGWAVCLVQLFFLCSGFVA